MAIGLCHKDPSNPHLSTPPPDSSMRAVLSWERWGGDWGQRGRMVEVEIFRRARRLKMWRGGGGDSRETHTTSSHYTFITAFHYCSWESEQGSTVWLLFQRLQNLCMLSFGPIFPLVHFRTGPNPVPQQGYVHTKSPGTVARLDILTCLKTDIIWPYTERVRAGVNRKQIISSVVGCLTAENTTNEEEQRQKVRPQNEVELLLFENPGRIRQDW